MRRHIIGFIGAMIITVGALALPPAEATPDAPSKLAHDLNSQSYDIADWWDAYIFGPEDNNWHFQKVAERHWWGRHQVHICYQTESGAYQWLEVLYDRYDGEVPQVIYPRSSFCHG